MNEASDTPVQTVSILSIDAWRDGDGWQWNNWFKVGTTAVTTCDAKPRQLLRYLRERGFLSEHSKGRVAIEDDQYNVVIVDKGTREPLFAIAYGEVL